jgi:hypothetical protein
MGQIIIGSTALNMSRKKGIADPAFRIAQTFRNLVFVKGWQLRNLELHRLRSISICNRKGSYESNSNYKENFTSNELSIGLVILKCPIMVTLSSPDKILKPFPS